MAYIFRVLKAIPWAISGKFPTLRPLIGPLTDEDIVRRQARGNLHLQRGKYMTEEDAKRRRARFIARAKRHPSSE